MLKTQPFIEIWVHLLKIRIIANQYSDHKVVKVLLLYHCLWIIVKYGVESNTVGVVLCVSSYRRRYWTRSWRLIEGLSCVSRSCARASSRSRHSRCRSNRPGATCFGVGCASGAPSRLSLCRYPTQSAVKVRRTIYYVQIRYNMEWTVNEVLNMSEWLCYIVMRASLGAASSVAPFHLSVRPVPPIFSEQENRRNF